jgi:signal transduction histidine kinase
MAKEFEKQIKHLEQKIKIKNFQLSNIRHLTEELYLIKNIEQLFDVIEFTCVGFFQFKPIILFFDGFENNFYCSKKKSDDINNLIVSDALNLFFKNNFKISSLKDLIDTDTSNKEKYLKLDSLGVKHVFPLFFKNQLKGLFFFGDKRTKLPVKENDIELLSITGQIAIAVKENILLVQSLLNKNIELNKSFEKQKTLFAELEATYEELKSVDKLKDSFLTLITHELNTPLTIIKSYSEALTSGVIEPTDTEATKEFYVAIQDNANLLINIVKSIISLTKLQNNQVQFKFDYYNIYDLVNICLDDFETPLKEKNIIVEQISTVSKDILCDESFIRKVIMIILDNAIKFSENDQKIKVNFSEDEKGVSVSIQDFGIGIEPEIKKNIFNKFSQAESIMHHSEGLGISLAIAKLIVEKGHKGKISVESELKKGSTFKVFIPFPQKKR